MARHVFMPNWPTRGSHVSCKRVARLMRAADLQGVSRRKGPRTTRRQPGAQPAPDLVQRDFTATGPDELWVADITYVATWAGWLYLAVVRGRLEPPGGRLGHGHSSTHRVGAGRLGDGHLPAAAPGRHSSLRSGQPIYFPGLRQPLPGGRHPAFHGLGRRLLRQCPCVRASSPPWNVSCWIGSTLQTPAEARLAVFQFIEGWYNPHRRHSALG